MELGGETERRTEGRRDGQNGQTERTGQDGAEQGRTGPGLGVLSHPLETFFCAYVLAHACCVRARACMPACTHALAVWNLILKIFYRLEIAWIVEVIKIFAINDFGACRLTYVSHSYIGLA